MPAAVKDRSIAAFASGVLRLLVATTVIEVGIDVPAASVMVIERAERFGLAQLHQLRGRVGRGAGARAACCSTARRCGAVARARLEAMRATDDGFRIADEDLRLRGPGEVLGARQSGLPALRIADLAAHADLLGPARDEVRLWLDCATPASPARAAKRYGSCCACSSATRRSLISLRVDRLMGQSRGVAGSAGNPTG